MASSMIREMTFVAGLVMTVRAYTWCLEFQRNFGPRIILTDGCLKSRRHRPQVIHQRRTTKPRGKGREEFHQYVPVARDIPGSRFRSLLTPSLVSQMIACYFTISPPPYSMERLSICPSWIRTCPSRAKSQTSSAVFYGQTPQMPDCFNMVENFRTQRFPKIISNCGLMTFTAITGPPYHKTINL